MPYYKEKLKEEKVYKRRRKNKKHYTSAFLKITRSYYKNELRLYEITLSHIIMFLNELGFTDLSNIDADISINKDFSFILDYKHTYNTITKFVGAIVNNIGRIIEVDFSGCKKIDTAPIFIMQVIRFEIDSIVKSRLKGFVTISTSTEFKIIPSKSKYVNRLLFLCGLLSRDQYDECLKDSNDDNTDAFEPIYRTGYYKGSKSQKHYTENKKSSYTTAIVNYLNRCLNKHNTSLNKIGQNSLEGIISEVLNNAEDHGVFNTWYVTANFSQELSKTIPNEDVVGELNLSILNFGPSIYEGLYETKDQNNETFDELIKGKANLEEKFPNHGFSEENLFTLYALHDGISRLKFEDQSRGTGTIKFLNSFLKLGDFEDQKKSYIPQLSIFSGQTMLICDNNNKPFDNNGVYLLTLNPENSLRYPPERSNLKELSNKFPGTLLNVHLYLSKSHLDKKIIPIGNANRTQSI